MSIIYKKEYAIAGLKKYQIETMEGWMIEILIIGGIVAVIVNLTAF